MTLHHNKQKRWPPTLSVKTLLIVVTLACCYASCWGPTKTRGVQDVLRYLNQRSVPQLHITRLVWGESGTTPLVVGVNINETRCYYLWLFGFISKLPYEGQANYEDMRGSWNVDGDALRNHEIK